ncbi:MAG TPA: hypothetical protein VGO11_26460 [Chthoniobacteraceae bacterium]|jgi:hypothetical protein|nr:hypothetical protein [Chthoniobacteraceae bacterium]
MKLRFLGLFCLFTALDSSAVHAAGRSPSADACEAPRSLRPGQSACVRLRASEVANNTHLLLRAGEVYDFRCDSQYWKDLVAKVSPAGDAPAAYRAYMTLFSCLKRCPHAPWFALIGKTTTSDDHCFLIGSGLVAFKVQQTGVLRCFANDALGFYWNNSGEVYLTVKRRR